MKKPLQIVTLIITLICILMGIYIFTQKTTDYNHQLEELSKKASVVNNSYESARIIENLTLPKFSKYTHRSGNKLSFKLKNGMWGSMVDTNADSDQMLVFNLVYYFQKLGFYLIHVQKWEGDTYYLVDDIRGKKIQLDGIPIFSPDKSKFVVISKDMDAEYNPTSIEVWELSQPGMAKRLDRLEPEKWGPKSARWKNDDCVEIEKEGYEFKSNTYPSKLVLNYQKHKN